MERAFETETDIANAAFTELGEPPIATLYPAENDDIKLTKLHRSAQRLYPVARDFLLRQRPWGRARATASLPALAEEDDQFSTVCALPPDTVRMIRVVGANANWAIRAGDGAGRIATDAAAPVKIVYTRRIPVSQMPAELGYAIAMYLALLLAKDKSESRAKKAEMKDTFREAYVAAKAADSAERGSSSALTGSRWLSAMGQAGLSYPGPFE